MILRIGTILVDIEDWNMNSKALMLLWNLNFVYLGILFVWF